MLKAIKECLKSWLVEHERLYWYIVVGIAVFLFGLITAMGCAKLYDANAAQDVTVNWKGSTVTKKVYDLTELDWVTYYDGEYTPEQIISECTEYFVRDTGSDIEYVFLKEPIYYNNADTRQYSFDWNAGNYFINVRDMGTGTFCVCKVQTTAGTFVAYNSGQNFMLGSTYDYFAENTHADMATKKDQMPRNNLNYPVLKVYDSSAPYISFKKLRVENKLATGDIVKRPIVISWYDSFIKTAKWEYVGYLKNIDRTRDLSYLLEVDFVVELPTEEYIMDMFEDVGLESTFDNFMEYADSMVEVWNDDLNAQKRSYEFKYTFPIQPDEDGIFSYELSYEMIETLIKYFNPDALEYFKTLTDKQRTMIMTFMHVYSCSTIVKTERIDSVAYGKGIMNFFDRGVYLSAVEIELDLDILGGTPEDVDKYIQNSIDKGFEEYRKDLKDKLDEQQSKLDSIYSVEGAFTNLQSTDLWTGFQSLVAGLGSLAPSISSLTVLVGAVFGFLPSPITGIISTTLFAVCIIAIIKAIRG